jgi:hypothetical protein
MNALWPVASTLKPCPIRMGVVQPSTSAIKGSPRYQQRAEAVTLGSILPAKDARQLESSVALRVNGKFAGSVQVDIAPLA